MQEPEHEAGADRKWTLQHCLPHLAGTHELYADQEAVVPHVEEEDHLRHHRPHQDYPPYLHIINTFITYSPYSCRCGVAFCGSGSKLRWHI